MKRTIASSLLLLLLCGVAPSLALAATAETALIRQDCSGQTRCFTSLAAWQAAFGGIDFGSCSQGDLVCSDQIAVARIEGSWSQADIGTLDIGGWITDPERYVRIFTAADARHSGRAGTGYRLSVSSAIDVTVQHVMVDGIELYAPASDGFYLRCYGDSTTSFFRLEHSIIHGDPAGSTGYGVENYDCAGELALLNNLIYDVAALGYEAGVGNGSGTALLVNNTIVDTIAGFGVRSNGGVRAINNLVDATGTDFYGGYAVGSDFNASSDGSAPGAHSRRAQSFVFVDRGNDDYHLSSTAGGARDQGLDLAHTFTQPLTDDIDGESRPFHGWDIGADEVQTGSDGVLPVILAARPAGLLPAATTQVALQVDSSETASCRLATTAGVDYASMATTFVTTGGLAHSHDVSGLQEEQTYRYYVRCADAWGNAMTADQLIEFTIGSSDVTPPVISAAAVDSALATQATISWSTDEGASSQVEYGTLATFGRFTLIDVSRTLAHALLLRGLEPATSYHYRVRSRDFAGNEALSTAATFSTSALGGQTYHVDQHHAQASDSNPGTATLPFLTIQHAVDLAVGGDTVVVMPGSYARVDVTHSGQPGNPIVVRGFAPPDRSSVDPLALFDPAHPSALPANPANAVTAGFVLRASDVRIQDFEVTQVTGRGAINLDQTQRVEVIGNFIHDNNISNYDYIGILGNGHANTDAIVRGNALYRVQGTTISIVGSNWLVEENDLSHGLDTRTDTGEEVGGDSDAFRFFGSGHVIRHNFVHDYLDEEQTGSPHIDCFQTFSVYPDSQFADHILVEGNTCVNTGQILMSEDSSEETGGENKVHHLVFRNNVFRGARAFAVILGGYIDHFTFVNNVVADTNYGGMAIGEQSPYLTVLNNIFYDNGSGTQLADETSKPGSVFDHNLHYPDFSNPAKQPEFDRHSLFGVDPQFVDATHGNFHLLPTSPAIDRGLAQADFNYDQGMAARPQQAGWDLGAWEYTGAVVSVDAGPADGTSSDRTTTGDGSAPADAVVDTANLNDAVGASDAGSMSVEPGCSCALHDAPDGAWSWLVGLWALLRRRVRG